jgi:hypothetical protein
VLRHFISAAIIDRIRLEFAAMSPAYNVIQPPKTRFRRAAAFAFGKWVLDAPEARWIAGIAIVCGVLGVIGGFALDLFIVHAMHEQLPFWIFVVILIIATVVARITEYLREVIQNPSHAKHESNSPSTFAISLCLVALFELYVIAFHELPKVEWNLDPGRPMVENTINDKSAETIEHNPEVNGSSHREAPKVAEAEQAHSANRERSPAWEQAVVVLVWLAAGISLSLVLSLLPGEWPNAGDADSIEGSLRGGIVACVVAPALTLLAIVLVRLGQTFVTMTTYPETWRDHVEVFVRKIPVLGNYFSAILASFLLPRYGAWGGWISLAVFAAFLLYCFAHPKRADLGVLGVLALLLVFISPWLNLQIFLPPLLVFLAFLVPCVFLGAIVPLLREPGESWKFWGGVAAAVAVVLLGLTLIRSEGAAWMLTAAAAMAVLSSFAFRRSAKKAWPLLAVCVALCVSGATRLGQYATFAGTLGEVHRIVNEPLALSVPSQWRRWTDYDRLTDSIFDRPVRDLNDPRLATGTTTTAEAERQLRERFARRQKEIDASMARFGHIVPRDGAAEPVGTGPPRVQPDWSKWKPSPSSPPDGNGTPVGPDVQLLPVLPDSTGEKPTPSTPPEPAKPVSATPPEAARTPSTDVSARQTAIDAAEEMVKERTRRQELCIASSMGFWITISVLASWAILRGGQETER